MKLPKPLCIKVCSRYFSICFTHDPYVHEIYAVVSEAKKRLGGSQNDETGVVLEHDTLNVCHLLTMPLLWSCNEPWQYAMLAFGYQPFDEERVEEYNDDDDQKNYRQWQRMIRICREHTTVIDGLPTLLSPQRF